MRVAVIGGGIAGLAAAHRLVEHGHDAVVLEASRRAGGVLRSEPEGGWLHEHAANALLAGAPDGAVALCRELGVELAEPAPAAGNRWVFLDGALQPLPHGPGDLVRTHLLSARAKLGLLGEALRKPRRLGPSAEEDESVWEFAARRLGPEVARAFVAPFVTGIFAGDAREISVVAGFPRIAALEARGGLVRGMLASRKEARAQGREKTRSLAPRGGVEELPRALVARLGDRVRLGARVTAVTPVAGGVEVAVDGAIERAGAAVIAAPAHAVPALVPALPEVARIAAEIPYAPVAIAYLGYRRADLTRPLDGFGVLVGEGEPARVLGVVFESSVWQGRAPDDHALLRCIYGGRRDPGALDLDDDALIAQARRDLATVVGVPAAAAPVHTHVVRWPRAIPQYLLGHAARVAAADAAARAARVVLTGAAWHGPAVTDCVADAHRVVREVAALT